MIPDFASRFDSFYAARRDQRSYLESVGYLSAGDRTLWQPQYEVDAEAETVNCGPGAMSSVGELDDVWENNDEPELMFEEF